MLQIRSAGQEVDVSGSPADVRDLAEFIRTGGGGVLRIDAAADPSPYQHSSSKVEVVVDDSAELLLTSLEVSHQALRFVGPRWALELLAENMENQADEPAGHLHIEWFPDHFYLSPGSLSLVVSVDESPH
jgi:hypothetical protein